MSSVLGVSKSLVWDKFKLVNIVLFFNLIEVAVLIYLLKANKSLNLGYSAGNMILNAVVVYILGVILLVRFNEQTFANGKYRLIPITETQLYLSNFLTTGLVYLYFWIVETAILEATFFVESKQFLPVFDRLDLADIKMLIVSILLSFLGIALIWTMSTVIHLLGNWLTNILPVKSQKLTMTFFYIIVLSLTIAVFYFTLNAISLSRIYEATGRSYNLFWIMLLISYLLGIICFSWINIYLLKRCSEINR